MTTDEVFKIAVKVTFDEAALMRRFHEGASLAQMKLDQQVIADSNYYCPLKTGTLQRTAIIGTVIGSGLVVWQTPYARAQYYGVRLDHTKGANPNACAKWFEAAKAHKLGDWRRLVDDTIKGG